MKHPESARSGLAWRGLAVVAAAGLIILAGGAGTAGWPGAPGSMAPAAFVSSAPASQPAAAASVSASQSAAAASAPASQPPAATVPAGPSSPSSTVSATPAAPAAPVTAPGAPTGLQAVGGGNHVTLSWSAPASTGGAPITGYRIYVGTAPAFRDAVPTMTSAGPSATVDQLPGGTTYYFAVTAVNAQGAGAMSPVATATTAAPAQPATSGPPTGLSARPDGSQVILSWSGPAGYPQPSGYLIYAGTRPGGELGTPVGKIPVRSTDCVVAGLTGGTRYYFEVTAVGAAGDQSARSAEVSAVPVTAGAGSGTDPGTPVFPVEGQSGPASATQVAEMAQAPASAGEPSWLIIALAAVAVVALAGALAIVVHLRRYPARLASPSPRALQTIGPNGPDGRPAELLSGRPHRR